MAAALKPAALLLALAATLCLAVVRGAAPPPVEAEAYYVQNGVTGEVLAAEDARERLPMASITKLMTALVALEHASPDSVATVSQRTASIGESTINLRPGERVSLRDLIRAALVQSANDAANAIAAFVGRGSVGRFVELMNARARSLGLADTHFVNPDGLDAPGHVSSARDVTRLARIAMRDPFIRETVRLVDATAAGRRLHTWNDLLSTFPNLLGVKTGHTNGAGWSQVAAARGGGVTIYATLLGGETREGRNSDLTQLLAWGLARYRTVWAIDGGRTYGTVRTAYGKPAVRVVAERPALRIVRVERPLVERVVLPLEAELPVRKGQRLGEVQILARGAVIARSAARRGACRRAPGSARTHKLLRRPHARPSRRRLLMIVTVTLNAALDRTLTVPHFLRGQRHRASTVLTLAGGKGINVARALKRLDVPVVATGLAGGRTGTRIVEELTAEAILNDFVRIGEESRTSTAVVDPTESSYTEINEWGPKVTTEELEMLLEKLHYLSRGADVVVFAGSLPRGVEESFYAEAVRDLNRRGVQSVLDSEGQPLRLGTEAEPYLVSPNQREAEHVVGQELDDEEDFLMALDAIAELGARNVHITLESGSYALFREDRQVRRYKAVAPSVEAVSVVGAGDVLLAQFIAAQLAGRSSEEALRLAVAAGTASTLEVGAGRFDPRDAAGSSPGSSSPSSRPSPELPCAPWRGRSFRSTRSSAVRASPSTTSCWCPPSRPCCRTTCARRRA